MTLDSIAFTEFEGKTAMNRLSDWVEKMQEKWSTFRIINIQQRGKNKPMLILYYSV